MLGKPVETGFLGGMKCKMMISRDKNKEFINAVKSFTKVPSPPVYFLEFSGLSMNLCTDKPRSSGTYCAPYQFSGTPIVIVNYNNVGIRAALINKHITSKDSIKDLVKHILLFNVGLECRLTKKVLLKLNKKVKSLEGINVLENRRIEYQFTDCKNLYDYIYRKIDLSLPEDYGYDLVCEKEFSEKVDTLVNDFNDSLLKTVVLESLILTEQIRKEHGELHFRTVNLETT